VISIVLGVIQVWVGILVKMYALIRAGEVKEGILSQGSWGLLIPGLMGVVAQKAGIINSSIPLYVMYLGAFLVMYSASRGQKNILLKPFAGLYGLYSIVGYFSDTMSYSRLLALGLASAVIGVVVNKMAELVVGMVPVVGWVFVPIILLGGHIFNLVINVLGSFIHAGRLQFVEFFTKFFEGGGRPFKPLKRVSDNVSLN
jgi:V/A-type H+-transporting ATPase subunit I